MSSCAVGKVSGSALELQFCLYAQGGQYPQHQVCRDILSITVQDRGYTSAGCASEPRNVCMRQSLFADHLDDLVVEVAAELNPCLQQ
jgi:hypothetical protein